jgi:hypothetical protein
VNVEVILRDASNLARACGQAAQKIIDTFTLEPEIRFSAHVTNGERADEIEQALHSASAKTMHDIEEALDLLRSQAKIRAIAYKANSEGVNQLISEKETYLLAAERALKDTYLDRSSRSSRHGKHDVADVQARLKGITRRLQTVTNDLVSDVVQVPRLSDGDTAKVEDRLSEIQRRLRTVSRELGHANFAVSIELPDDVVATLRKHKII